MSSLEFRTIINGKLKYAEGRGVCHDWTYELDKDGPNNWTAFVVYPDGERLRIRNGINVSFAQARRAANAHHDHPGAL